MDEGEEGIAPKEVPPFPELFPVREVMLSRAKKEGINAFLRRYEYRKYQPCMLCSLYFILNNVEMEQPIDIVYDVSGMPYIAAFEGFEIKFDEAEDWYDLIVAGDLSQYGKDFRKYAESIVRVRNEDGVCRSLLSAIVDFTSGSAEITNYGMSVLYCIASFMVLAIRRQIKEVRMLPKAAEAHRIPELQSVVNLIGYIMKTYKMSLEEVIELIRRQFK